MLFQCVCVHAAVCVSAQCVYNYSVVFVCASHSGPCSACVSLRVWVGECGMPSVCVCTVCVCVCNSDVCVCRVHCVYVTVTCVCVHQCAHATPVCVCAHARDCVYQL